MAREPDCGDAWANLAACRLRTGRFREAKNALERAVRARPEDFRLWENLARCCCALDRTAEAVVALHRILDLDCKRPVSAYADVIARASARGRAKIFARFLVARGARAQVINACAQTLFCLRVCLGTRAQVIHACAQHL